MTPTRICKTFRFDAAHRLPYHDGKCAREHGHTYRVDITLVGELHTDGPKRGMVVDFGDVADAWKFEVEPMLDHQNINQTLIHEVEHTTAELLARWVHERMSELLGDSVERVRVHETATSWAEYPA